MALRFTAPARFDGRAHEGVEVVATGGFARRTHFRPFNRRNRRYVRQSSRLDTRSVTPMRAERPTAIIATHTANATAGRRSLTVSIRASTNRR